MVNFNEQVGVRIASLNDCTRAFGHKSALDIAGASYTSFGFDTVSACYDVSQATTAAHALTVINTIMSELEKKGILIKA